MFKRKNDWKPFESKVWLASPTMHGEEMKYVTEAYDTNWMSTVGANINEVERLAAEQADALYIAEEKYIKKVSLFEDIKIILQTVEKAFIKQEGITEEDS